MDPVVREGGDFISDVGAERTFPTYLAGLIILGAQHHEWIDQFLLPRRPKSFSSCFIQA